VPGDDRAAREAVYTQVAEDLSAACVATIGKLAIFYRPRPDEEEPPARAGKPRR
jgi:RNA-binding protein YhbY